MIDSVEIFSERLNQLDPDDVAFVLHVDSLVEQTSLTTLEVVYPVVFRYFEAHPENDCGMPGTLVHLLETYYPNYVEALIESIQRTPSANTVLMANRILNADADNALRCRLTECLRDASIDQKASPPVREAALRYLNRHA